MADSFEGDNFRSRADLTDWALKLHGRVVHDESNQPVIRCPGPGHSLEDDSLLVRFDDDASGGFRVQTFCMADDDPKMLRDYVRKTVGLPEWKPNGKGNGKHAPAREIVAKYLYETADGQPVLMVNRTKPKSFAQQRPDGHGGWEWGGIGEAAKVPFKLPELVEAIALGKTVFICEGEKAVLALMDKGQPATCSPGGAGKWPKHFAKWFVGADVVILPDNDQPGHKHAERVRDNLAEVVQSLRTIHLPGVIHGGDVWDWLASGGDATAITALPAGPPVRGHRASELWDMSFPPINFAVPDLIAEGLTLIAGAPKRGKSWLALDLCCTVAWGGFTLGDRKCMEGDVLYAALEDSPRRMKDRLQRVCQLAKHAPHRLTVWFGRDLTRLGEGCEEALREWLDAQPAPRLIVIDTLNYIRPERMRDEDPYSYDYRSAITLQRLASEYGVAVVLIHHTRKSVADDYLESISGTNGLTGGSDAVIVLERQGDGTTVFKGRGRDIEEFEMAVRFDKEECRWRVMGDMAEVAVSEARAKIMRHMQEAGWFLTPGEIAAQTGLRRNVVDQQLFKMVKAGQIVRAGRGRYGLPKVIEGDEGEDDDD